MLDVVGMHSDVPLQNITQYQASNYYVLRFKSLISILLGDSNLSFKNRMYKCTGDKFFLV